MPDVLTPAKRREVMSRIRWRGNRDTEMALAALLRREGITGWRRQRVLRVSAHSSAANVQLPKFGVGRSEFLRIRPDFIFPKRKVAAFVDGCFWHGCPVHASPGRWLRRSAMPRAVRAGAETLRTGKRFWREKLVANVERDRRVIRVLRRAGWRVVRIWEHELAGRGPRSTERVMARIRKALADV